MSFNLIDPLVPRINGYKINPHFANILRIINIWETAKNEQEKHEAVARYFFIETFQRKGTLDLRKAVELFCAFLMGFKESSESEEKEKPKHSNKTFCYRIDAEEIYADFMREYSIDLKSVEYLHWHQFSVLLQELSPKSSFKRKIELRFMDLSEIKDSLLLAKLQRAKEAVQIPVRWDYALDEEPDDFMLKLQAGQARIRERYSLNQNEVF